MHKIALRRVEKVSYPTSIIKSNAMPIPSSNPIYKLVPDNAII